MGLTGRILGFENATPEGLKLAKTIAILISGFSISFQISSTFYMIFIAEALGGGSWELGIALIGLLVVIRLVVQTILDYPTGALGDWIGQRWVIASALVCYGIAFYLTSLVTVATPFFIFLAIYVLFGVGASQESGAFGAWFDNNYRVAMPHDKDRKQYGAFWGRVGMFWQIVATLVLIPGSLLALLTGRAWIFQLQAVFSVALAGLVLLKVKDLPGVRDEKKKRSLREYGGLLVDGVKFLGSSKFIAFTILGEVIMISTGILWGEIILWSLYFAYLLNEVAVATFRTIIFVPNAMLRERSGFWSRRFEPKKWIPRFRFLQFCGFSFYLLLTGITFLFPAPLGSPLLITVTIPFTSLPLIQLPLVSIIPVVLIFSTFIVSSFFAGFSGILTQRIMIDVVPSRIRNSLYSLRPTLAMLFAIPLVLYLAQIQQSFGLPLTLLLCSLVALIGALLIKKGFSYPIPKAETTEKPPEEPGEVKAVETATETPEESTEPEYPVEAPEEAKAKGPVLTKP